MWLDVSVHYMVSEKSTFALARANYCYAHCCIYVVHYMLALYLLLIYGIHITYELELEQRTLSIVRCH